MASAKQPSTALPIRAIAGMFGLAGFAIAMLAGLAAGNSAWRVLLVGLVSLVVCHVLGTVAGMVLDHVVREHLRTSQAGGVPSQSVDLVASGEPRRSSGG